MTKEYLDKELMAFCSRCGTEVEHQEGRCPEHGTYCKGFSGHKGFKKVKPGQLTKADKKKIGSSPVEAFKFLLENARTYAELRTAAKDYIDYVAPKLSAIKQEVKKDTNITISWVGADDQDYIDVSEMHKTIDHDEVVDLQATADKAKEILKSSPKKGKIKKDKK
jgi:hypothetical protein